MKVKTIASGGKIWIRKRVECDNYCDQHCCVIACLVAADGFQYIEYHCGNDTVVKAGLAAKEVGTERGMSEPTQANEMRC